MTLAEKGSGISLLSHFNPTISVIFGPLDLLKSPFITTPALGKLFSLLLV